MRRRSEKLARHAKIVNATMLVAGVDIAKRESVVVFVRARDKVRLGALSVPTNASGLARLAAEAERLRVREGLVDVVLAMEATGYLWRILAREAERRALRYVVVQSFVVARSRELDDLTRDKTDQRDAGLIADLACELRFSDVQLETGSWGELRSLAEARQRARVERCAALQEQRALLELTWPELLRVAPSLAGSHLQALLRLGLGPVEIASLSRVRFVRLLRREHAGRFIPAMARRLHDAALVSKAADQSPAATLRLQLAAERAAGAGHALTRLDDEMRRVFEATGLAHLRGQIRGLGDVLLHNLLAASGDPRRLDDPRCMVKLAGSNPTERSSGEVKHGGGIHRRGRPLLRLLAHQAAVCLVRYDPAFRARFLHLTLRATRPLERKQAYVAVANKLLRTLWVLAVRGEPYRRELVVAEAA